eukprot:595410-Prymnesium_polylepis.1
MATVPVATRPAPQASLVTYALIRGGADPAAFKSFIHSRHCLAQAMPAKVTYDDIAFHESGVQREIQLALRRRMCASPRCPRHRAPSRSEASSHSEQGAVALHRRPRPWRVQQRSPGAGAAHRERRLPDRLPPHVSLHVDALVPRPRRLRLRHARRRGRLPHAPAAQRARGGPGGRLRVRARDGRVAPRDGRDLQPVASAVHGGGGLAAEHRTAAYRPHVLQQLLCQPRPLVGARAGPSVPRGGQRVRRRLSAQVGRRPDPDGRAPPARRTRCGGASRHG